jgi:hypothetical protein
MATVDDVPAMPVPEVSAPKKRGRKPKVAGDSPAPAPLLTAESRMALAEKQGPALAPYAAAMLRVAERGLKIEGVDASKREAAAAAIGVAVIYTIPSLDPIWLVWGMAVAACADCYLDPKIKKVSPDPDNPDKPDAK